jgi:phosphotransferase system HPr-like phosphotransfer protein
LEITATGQDAEAALAALCDLVDQGFELNEPSEANNSPWL